MTKTTPIPAQVRQLERLRESCEARQTASAARGPIDPDTTFELNPTGAEASQPSIETFELNPVEDVFVAELLPSDDVIAVSLPDLIFDAYRFQRSAK